MPSSKAASLKPVLPASILKWAMYSSCSHSNCHLKCMHPFNTLSSELSLSSSQAFTSSDWASIQAYVISNPIGQSHWPSVISSSLTWGKSSVSYIVYQMQWVPLSWSLRITTDAGYPLFIISHTDYIGEIDLTQWLSQKIKLRAPTASGKLYSCTDDFPKSEKELITEGQWGWPNRIGWWHKLGWRLQSDDVSLAGW